MEERKNEKKSNKNYLISQILFFLKLSIKNNVKISFKTIKIIQQQQQLQFFLTFDFISVEDVLVDV